jgi:hypothetical protein
MTLAEWQRCSSPEQMLHLLGDGASPRKLRLYAIACCRRIWPWLTERNREALAVAERYADGQATLEELSDAQSVAGWAVRGACQLETELRKRPDWNAAWDAGWEARIVARDRGLGDWEKERAAQADLLREIFGDPEHPADFADTWRWWNDGCVVKMAQGIYDEQRFGDLPILADALLDAGCDSDEVLAHCSASGPHVRGCWVLDLVLAKT